MRVLHTTLLLFFVLASTINAQPKSTISIEEIVGEILNQLTEENEDETADFSMYYDDLLALAEDPININTDNENDLKSLFFLSDVQIENILFYTYRYGKLRTLYELRLIEGLNNVDIQRIIPFVYLGDTKDSRESFSLKRSLKYGKNNLFLLFKSTVEKPKGYKTMPETENKDNQNWYLGNRFYHSLRYRFQYKNRLSFGLTGEKDAGELFFQNKKGYDFSSAYVQLNDIKNFKSINIGDFRANFGEGLVLRTNMTMGKTDQVLNRPNIKDGLQKYGSTDEYNFFRGLGVNYKIGKFNITSFYSNKMIDADTINGEITSIYKSGLHRTKKELEKRKTVNQMVVGGNLTLSGYRYRMGFSIVHTKLDHIISPRPSAYNAHAFQGNEQTTAGLHYRFRWHKINIFGETAMTNRPALASTNGLSFSPISTVGILVIHRYLPAEYNSFYARSFASTAQSRNETGLYLGVEVCPIKNWKIAAYADNYRFPWLKNNTSAPSIAADYLLNVEHNRGKNLQMYWRLNYKEKEINSKIETEKTMQLIAYKQLNFRYALRYNYGAFLFQTIVNANLVKKGNNRETYGISALQDLSYTCPTLPLRIDLRYQFFDAKEYDNRIFSYEKDVLYAFSIPMNYGIGSRYYINLKYDFMKNISLWLKASQTSYADNRKKTGSGYNEILGNRKTDIHLLLRWTFRYSK